MLFKRKRKLRHIKKINELKSLRMFHKWFKVIGNSSPMMESIGRKSSTDQNSLDESAERSSIAKLVDSTPTSTPFRKKAITSIERTRKLSILLRHQHYLVSEHADGVNFNIFIGNDGFTVNAYIIHTVMKWRITNVRQSKMKIIRKIPKEAVYLFVYVNRFVEMFFIHCRE